MINRLKSVGGPFGSRLRLLASWLLAATLLASLGVAVWCGRSDNLRGVTAQGSTVGVQGQAGTVDSEGGGELVSRPPDRAPVEAPTSHRNRVATVDLGDEVVGARLVTARWFEGIADSAVRMFAGGSELDRVRRRIEVAVPNGVAGDCFLLIGDGGKIAVVRCDAPQGDSFSVGKVLLLETGEVSGVVRFASGLPAPGTRVVVRPHRKVFTDVDGALWEGLAGPDGHFVIPGVPYGEHLFECHGSGVGEGVVRVRAPKNGLDVVVAPASAVLSGKVIGDDLAREDVASVVWRLAGRQEVAFSGGVHIAAGGDFFLDLPGVDRVDLGVMTRDGLVRYCALDVSVPQVGIVLTRPTLTAVALRVVGAPESVARSSTFMVGTDDPHVGRLVACSSDESGVRVVKVWPGEYEFVAVPPDDRWAGVARRVMVPKSAVSVDVVLDLVPLQEVSITCVDRDGRPVPGVRLTVFEVAAAGDLVQRPQSVLPRPRLGVDKSEWRVESNELGIARWAGANLEARYFCVQANCPGFVRTKIPGRHFGRGVPVTLVLTRGCRLQVDVGVPGGSDAYWRDFHLAVEVAGEWYPSQRMSACPNVRRGVLEIGGLPEGTAKVRVGNKRSGWSATTVAEVQLVEGREAAARVDLGAWSPVLSVLFVQEDGNPAGGRKYLLAPFGSSIHEVDGYIVETDAAGAAQVEVPAGSYVWLRGEGNGPTERWLYGTMQVPASAGYVVDVRAYEISRLLVDAQGVPLANRRIEISSAVWGDDVLTSDARGLISSKRGPFGEFRIRAGDLQALVAPQRAPAEVLRTVLE